MQKNTLLGSTTGSAAGPSTGFTGGSGAGGSGAGGSGAGGNVGKSPAGYTRKKETTVYIYVKKRNALVLVDRLKKRTSALCFGGRHCNRIKSKPHGLAYQYRESAMHQCIHQSNGVI